MKKLFLSIALLCATGIIFAQTTSYEHWPRAEAANKTAAPDKANCDDCSVEQVATMYYVGDENASDIHQRGNDNKANVFQVGIGNYSMINQDGADNFLGTGGTNNKAMVYQSGIHNYSDINQMGDYNIGKVIQIGNNNYASQVVGVGWAENNMAYVNQQGNGNASSQSQYYDNNEAIIDQDGNDNDAIQYQSSNLNQGTGSFASIIQNGNENAAKETQNGAGNHAFVNQQGNNNIVKGDQVSDASNSFAWTNNYRILQVGNENMACSTQSTTDRYQYNYVYQFGNANKSVVNQTALAGGSYVANYSFTTQLGNNNLACVEQINPSNPN